ncbi:MAG: YicC/YloC family endoribonuclease [Pseudomonadota bacterium]
MVRSMTGFARATQSTEAGELSCELRAVNHRYLDTQVRLPEELRAAEPEFKTQLAANISRGKLECSIYLKRSGASSGRQQLNQDAIASLKQSLTELAGSMDGLKPVSPLEVLRWPGVLEDIPVESEALRAHADAILAEATEAFNRMREREGERLAQMLRERLEAIAVIAKDVRARRPEVIAAMRTKLQDRISSLAVDADPARLATEVALLSQKLDVDEELDRLDSHLIEINDVLGRDEPIGRRLDFLMQELNREANTLASKAADAATTNGSVDLKVLIEQMREQIQNIE